MSKPTLFCYGGSDGSQAALGAAAAFAQQLAEEGAAGARGRGYRASARVAEADESAARTIDEVAQEIEAALIVCGQRGRGAIRSALLGSVSHALASHTKRPLLMAPEHPA